MNASARPLVAAAIALLTTIGATSLAPSAAAPVDASRAVAEAIRVGDLAGAERLATALVRDARDSSDSVRQAWALMADGDVRFYRGDYPGSLARYDEAEILLGGADDDFALASARKNRAIALKLLGRVEEGVALLESVLPTMRELGSPRDVASVVENAAVGYLALGDDTRAHAYLSEALELAESSDDDVARFHTLTRLAVLYLHTGLPELALEPARAARSTGERAGLLLDLGWPESLEASALAQLGRRDEALALQQRAIDRAESIGNPAYVVEPYRRMGELVVEDDPGAALDWFERARQAASRVGMPTPWPIESGTGRALLGIGDVDGAVRHLQRAVDALERERGSIVDERYRAAFGGAHRGVYGRLVEALLERAATVGGAADVSAAFETIERATARRLMQTIQAARLGDELPNDPAMTARLDDVDRRIARLQSELIRHDTAAPRRQAILGELDRLEDDWAALVAGARAADPRWTGLRYPEPLDIEAATALVAGRCAMVIWFELPAGLAAFVVSAGRIQAVRLDVEPATLASRIRVLLDTMGDTDGAWRPVARRLHAELIAPLDDLVPAGTERLVVVPDGALHFLPFDLLLDDQDRFLLERFTVSYAPSATALAGLRERAASRPAVPGPDLLLLANPALAADTGPAATTRALLEAEGVDLRPLPFSAREARRVARFARRPDVFLGADANETRLDGASLESYRVLHFATHGAVSTVRPWRSALVLAAPDDGSEDGLLQVREIYGLRLAADLVVLAACRSARGQVLRGEGVEGLAEAFLRAGSRSVLASLIDVADDDTETLVTGFYERLAGGLPVADALREAKLAVVRRGDVPPAVWAGFVVIGDGEATVPLRAAATGPSAWIVGGALLVIVTALAAAVRRRGEIRGPDA